MKKSKWYTYEGIKHCTYCGSTVLIMNIVAVNCTNCGKVLWRDEEVLTPRQWKKKEYENKIANKAW